MLSKCKLSLHFGQVCQINCDNFIGMPSESTCYNNECYCRDVAPAWPKPEPTYKPKPTSKPKPSKTTTQPKPTKPTKPTPKPTPQPKPS